MLEAFANFGSSWLDPWLLMLTAAGTLAGIYVGAIPGLSVTMATSILISFTFKWPVNDALALIAEKEESSENLDVALMTFRLVLKRFERETKTIRWAVTQNNIVCLLNTNGERR